MTGRRVNGWMIATFALAGSVLLALLLVAAAFIGNFFTPLTLEEVRENGVVVDTLTSPDGRYVAVLYTVSRGGVLGEVGQLVELNIINEHPESVPYGAQWVPDHTIVFWNEPAWDTALNWAENDVLVISSEGDQGNLEYLIDIYDPSSYYNWADKL